MNYEITTTAYGSTGIKTITPGFSPKGYEIIVSGAYSSPDNYVHMSLGGAVQRATDTRTYCTSLLQDNSHNGVSESDATGVVVRQRAYVSGVITTVLEASHDSWTSTGFTINVTKATPTYNLTVKVWG